MLTYQECLEMIRGARNGRRKLDNNTYLYQKETGEFTVVLHRTAVVTVYPNNTFRLNTGGWFTVTTKDRVNRFAPVRISSRRGTWRLGNGELYQDGMVVDRFGKQTQASRIEMNKAA